MGFEPDLQGSAPHVDVAIVGAGISGLGMAAHLRLECPGRSFAILERRGAVGGTWDLFRYPGVRSDSDMHTLGYSFEPWTHDKSIADGEAILEYLNRIVDERHIRPHIRFGSRVISADWHRAKAHWKLLIEGTDGRVVRLSARFLYLGSGYYDYDRPHDAEFPGRDEFGGTVVHPQFWPDDLDYAGKNVVVIGSGATAATMVPAMAGRAAHVTMLQRTPSWYIARPARDRLANGLRKVLPARVAYALTRYKNVWLQSVMFKRARNAPDKVASYLTGKMQQALGDKYDAKAFTPPYGPWEQRLCLIPDGDLFAAIRTGKAEVVTDHIERFDATGIVLQSGKHLPADVIVTATGLRIAVAGKIAVSLDGVPVDFTDHFYYRACMFSNIPNLAVVFGYLNASWTLRADLNAAYVCRLLNRMTATGCEVATAVMADNHDLPDDNVYDFSSGYLQRAMHLMPRSAPSLPWRLNQDYLADKAYFRNTPIEDGIMRLTHAEVAAPSAVGRFAPA